MKITLFIPALIFVLTLGACSQAEVPKVETPTAEVVMPDVQEVTSKIMETKTKAVLVYADWCGSCKVLDPKVKKVQAMGKMPGLEFVTLDYTDKDADAFYIAANEAGVAEAVKTYLGDTIKTGQLLLIDLDDQKVVGKVTKTLDPSEIVTTLEDALAAS